MWAFAEGDWGKPRNVSQELVTIPRFELSIWQNIGNGCSDVYAAMIVMEMRMGGTFIGQIRHIYYNSARETSREATDMETRRHINMWCQLI
jgi:hypothetical protein